MVVLGGRYRVQLFQAVYAPLANYHIQGYSRPPTLKLFELFQAFPGLFQGYSGVIRQLFRLLNNPAPRSPGRAAPWEIKKS